MVRLHLVIILIYHKRNFFIISYHEEYPAYFLNFVFEFIVFTALAKLAGSAMLCHQTLLSLLVAQLQQTWIMDGSHSHIFEFCENFLFVLLIDRCLFAQ